MTDATAAVQSSVGGVDAPGCCKRNEGVQQLLLLIEKLLLRYKTACSVHSGAVSLFHQVHSASAVAEVITR
jgi:hypothetical protein